MSDPRFDIPVADLEEQARQLEDEDESTPAEGEPVPHTGRELPLDSADEADVLEQAIPVRETEDYPYGPGEEE
jgi:hypothetical protein